MATKSTGGMTDIIITRVNALVDEMVEAKGIADADVNALVANAAKSDPDYASVQELQAKYIAAWDALKDKVRDSVNVPSDQDQENARKSVVEIRKKMRDLYGAIPTILEVEVDSLELPEAFTSEVSKGSKSKSGTSGIRRPRLDSATISETNGGAAIKSWEDSVTVTKIAEFLEVENADLMVHIPENFKDKDKHEFTFSPDSGAYKGKHLDIVLIPRK